ncbi:unnamed protein product [Schistosoma margrebowiei]|uniref:Uncharacterized protein n=1 Tax=Schistosoma margrebowiei TaxID=48269 RepID=A0AA85A511_9TREM|nr:unnamed protein product [Schistosoma margrebowiei]
MITSEVKSTQLSNKDDMIADEPDNADATALPNKCTYIDVIPNGQYDNQKLSSYFYTYNVKSLDK